jgi:hypothetical protein
VAGCVLAFNSMGCVFLGVNQVDARLELLGRTE